MIEDTEFETFLYISKKKYQLFIYDKNNFKNLCNEEIKNDDEIELNILSQFLEENIYKFEKIINNFIRNIILIIEDDKVLDVGISIKKKKYKEYADQKHLENILVEAKDIFRENYLDQIIMHMIIISDNENDDFLFIEVKFISISNNFTFYFDKLLESHQIKISCYMSGNYIKSYIGESTIELSTIADKLNNGLNKNEVQLVSKNKENKGFFEKFFQLFS